MSRFKLLVFPDGRTLFTTEEELRPDEVAHAAKQINDWIEDKSNLVVPSTEIIMVEDIEFELSGPERDS